MVHMEVCLPQDKLLKCRDLIHWCLGRRNVRLRDLQSIIGTLNFACAVVKPGRPFLRRLINLTIGVRRPLHYVRVTPAAREDLVMWHSFLQLYNGRSLLLEERWQSNATLSLFTDASGTLGYGAVFGSHWFYGAWSKEWHGLNITLLELYPIVLAVKLWANHFSNQCIEFHTDNQALVAIINAQSSPQPTIMFLVRDLVLQCLYHNIQFRAVHVPGKENILADLLSRLQVRDFKQRALHADACPTEVPPLPRLPG